MIINGNLFADVLNGTVENDLLNGLSGEDSIYGFSGNDQIFGNQSDDYLNGGTGDDTVYGGQDQDLILGDEGHDLLFGNMGDDVLSGDTLSLLTPSPSGGNDTIYGGKGNDYVDGDAGNDILFGNMDNDLLVGILGNDILYGGQGNDTLYGGSGIDISVGGLGRDTFVFNPLGIIDNETGERDLAFADAIGAGSTASHIVDFNASEDSIAIIGLTENAVHLLSALTVAANDLTGVINAAQVQSANDVQMVNIVGGALNNHSFLVYNAGGTEGVIDLTGVVGTLSSANFISADSLDV